MSVPTSAEHLPPAARSGLDVAIWFLIRASEERQRVPMEKLQLLLYFAEAAFAAKHDGRRLMPGLFLAGETGPYEPNVALALECGLATPPQPTITAEAVAVLAALWKQYGAVPTSALTRVALNDGIWQSTLQRGINCAIDPAALGQAYVPKQKPAPKAERKIEPKAPAAVKSPAARRPEADLRFTGDGRLVTRWAPRRRIERG
jgi:uncharacterized phage-associated protein